MKWQLTIYISNMLGVRLMPPVRGSHLENSALYSSSTLQSDCIRFSISVLHLLPSPFTGHPTCPLTPLLPSSWPSTHFRKETGFSGWPSMPFPISFPKRNEMKWNTPWYKKAERTSNKLAHYFPPWTRGGHKQISAILLKGKPTQAGPGFSQAVTSSSELNAQSLTVSSGPDFQSAVNWYVFFFTFIIACFHLVYISKCTGFQAWTVILKKKFNFKKCRLADPMAPGRGPSPWLVGTPWRFSFLWANPFGSHQVGEWVENEHEGAQTAFIPPVWGGGMLSREERQWRNPKRDSLLTLF